MAAAHPLLTSTVRSAIEDAVSHHLGRRWVTVRFTDLNDRASHDCGVLHGEQLSVFAKLDRARGAEDRITAEQKVRAERDGLTLLQDRAGIAVPTPIGSGLLAVDDGIVLLTEALAERPPQERTPDDWRAIGHALATVHQVHGEQFGLTDFNGFFGALPQDNTPVASGSWIDFYRERRVLPLLRTVVDTGRLPREPAAELGRLLDRLPSLCGPEPAPTLLHGDAQQHNFVSSDAGAVLVDAAPYFGHPEIDLALLDYFQPVPADVFDGYREFAPIDPDFVRRRGIWRIFVDLACIAVDAGDYARRALSNLAATVRSV
ncbi:fructosamine kinase family protein [Microlunatus soli]|uniref:Fructosamine-3-kinase n=1 Tax=Microlunatus soli TaxID=630515 RepID=A0A1H1XHX7_9ACTN|nr:fructosamine kinase family protein [Microlunatus soli]SDT08844.1 Fructosamine-3-kinase [Microlunatus soli]